VPDAVPGPVRRCVGGSVAAVGEAGRPIVKVSGFECDIGCFGVVTWVGVCVVASCGECRSRLL